MLELFQRRAIPVRAIPCFIQSPIARERFEGVARTHRNGFEIDLSRDTNSLPEWAKGFTRISLYVLHIVYLLYQLFSRFFEAKQRSAIENTTDIPQAPHTPLEISMHSF